MLTQGMGPFISHWRKSLTRDFRSEIRAAKDRTSDPPHPVNPYVRKGGVVGNVNLSVLGTKLRPVCIPRSIQIRLPKQQLLLSRFPFPPKLNFQRRPLPFWDSECILSNGVKKTEVLQDRSMTGKQNALPEKNQSGDSLDGKVIAMPALRMFSV